MSGSTTTGILSESQANLQRLFYIRNATVIAQILVVGVSAVYLRISLPLLSIGLIICVSLAFNLLTAWWLSRGYRASQVVIFIQLLVDVSIFSALLYVTGGATNPFVLVYLLPIMIAATVLNARYTWSLAAITVVYYSLLTRYYIPMQHSHSGATDFNLHVQGMWVAFVLCTLVIAYFVVGMGRTLRTQQRDLANAREQALRDEQILALATIAASTAHELGTPLGTMALITEELADECDEMAPAIRERVEVLRSQIVRCKTALSTLSASAGNAPLDGGRAMNIDQYLRELLSEWQQSRPAVNLHACWHGEKPPRRVLADRSLTQALTNILDNAADASPEQVEWSAQWDNEELQLEVRDRGPGLTDEVRQAVGVRPYSDKHEGLGLGLFLAHAIIGRFGGTVTLLSRKGGGVKTRISLPLENLAVEL